MKNIFRLLASGGFIILAIVYVFSLPLSVVAVMNFFDMGWLSALIVIGIAHMIPIVGWLGLLIAPFLGLYYLYDANWDWHMAADSDRQLKITESMAQTYKQSCLYDTRLAEIRENANRDINSFCECLSAKVGSDGEYVKEYIFFLQSDSDVPNEAYKNANIRAISNAIKVCK